MEKYQARTEFHLNKNTLFLLRVYNFIVMALIKISQYVLLLYNKFLFLPVTNKLHYNKII